jgi:murein endopeptidase
MRRLAVLVWAAALACLPDDLDRGEPRGETVASRVAVAPEPPGAPPPPVAGASVIGDPGGAEDEILAMASADIGEAELLGLPGSQGFAIMGDVRSAVPEGGASVGTPDDGAVEGAVQLPFDPGVYTRRDATRSWATTQTIRTIQAAFTVLRRDRGVDAEVVIGDLSLPRGGAFAPHVSHRSGRDVDIRLVLAPGLDRSTIPFAPEQVDWAATWALVHSFLETGHVTYVFLEFGHQAHLRRAAEAAGIHSDVLDRWFQWPDAYDATAVVRHERGHRAHVHVRLDCEGQGPRCHGV